MSKRVHEETKKLAECGAHLGTALRFGIPPFIGGNEKEHRKRCADWIGALISLAEKTKSPAFVAYQIAYTRWKTFVIGRAATRSLKLVDRMQIGLGAVSALETNVTLHPLHGMPYIPGSSVKGALRAWLYQRVKVMPADGKKREWQILFTELFGDIKGDDVTAGALLIHDAWWVPEVVPLVREIETPHHADYYTGNAPAPTDFDDPNPITQMAVQGSFLFAIDHANVGKEWAGLCMGELTNALAENGIGGRTFAAGYGRFSKG